MTLIFSRTLLDRILDYATTEKSDGLRKEMDVGIGSEGNEGTRSSRARNDGVS